MYTSVSIMKMNAWSRTIRMWKIAQTVPATTWPTKPSADRSALNVQMEPSSAISRNHSSAAYYSRNDGMADDTACARNSLM